MTGVLYVHYIISSYELCISRRAVLPLLDHYIISSYELCISRRAALPFLEMLTVPFLLTSIKYCIHPEHFLSERVHQIFKCYDFSKHSVEEGFTAIF